MRVLADCGLSQASACDPSESLDTRLVDWRFPTVSGRSASGLNGLCLLVGRTKAQE